MTFGTPSVAVATTPTVISTFFSHLFASRSRKSASRRSLAEGGPGGGPENQLSYEEGLKVVRRFLEFASRHALHEVQSFTAMAVPVPHWVRRKTVEIPEDILTRAADTLAEHLASYGPHGDSGGGLELVGGSKWWRVRGRSLEGEWIEMQKDYLRRQAQSQSQSSRSSVEMNGNGHSESSTAPPTPVSTRPHHYLPHRAATLGSVKDNSGGEVIGERVILYIHGGAFFFSSLDTHRYQMQRHARKAGARVFAPAYRLAPQYPFPCGLQDALASYLYLLYPPPGAHNPILPSSIIFMGDSAGAGLVVSLLIVIREVGLPMPAGASLISPWVDLTHSMPSIGGWDGGDYIPSYGFHYKPGVAWPPLPGDGITVKMPDGSDRHFDEQIQMYCPNKLLTHPLISPVNAGSLGGLCPLLILGGGGELLRDEITYLAFKAASPTTYPPSSHTLAQYPDQAGLVKKYPPTKVHLQMYEGCCHVVTTLSWTRSSKYMYRACANFNIWAYKAAAKAVERHLKHKHSRNKIKSYGFELQMSNGNPLSSTAPGSEDNAAPQSPATTTAPSSRVPSILDLTQPIITATTAKLANAETPSSRDLESEASSSDTSDSNSIVNRDEGTPPPIGIVTVKGTEPVFGSANIVAERVSTHGNIRPFEAIEAVPALDPALREKIGQVRGDGAIQKWSSKRIEWDDKYAKELKKWREIKREDRVRAEAGGFLTRDLKGERPPMSALVSWWDDKMAREAGKSVDEVGGKVNRGIGMWTKMSSKADEQHAGGENMKEIKETVREELQVEKERRESVSRPSAAPILEEPVRS